MDLVRGDGAIHPIQDAKQVQAAELIRRHVTQAQQ
jgi:hypothetical protein